MNWILFLTLVIAAEFVPYAATEECVGSTESLCPSKRRTPSPNPFEKGCLLTIAEERNETELLLHKDKNRFQTVERICNSNDVADGLDQCYNENDHRYEEIRIAIGDWDSTIFISWIMQIILSELLRVPTTLEFGFDDKKHMTSMGSFYDRESRYTYSDTVYGYEWLKEAKLQNGNCSKAEKPCAHIIPEIWREFIENDFILPPIKNGSTGNFGYYIPKYTAEKYPELLSHFGLSNNAQKLAEVFKIPITWGVYCSSYSNCTFADGVATRLPINDKERSSYFLEGGYKGFFKENECNARTCAGHFADLHCEWYSFSDSQFYWHNISLASAGPNAPNNGYTQAQLTEIVFAANASRSDVMFQWFQPDRLISSFSGTEMEFQRIMLPATTLECLQYRSENNESSKDRCSITVEERRGSKAGSCDYHFDELTMAVSEGLKMQTGGHYDDYNDQKLRSEDLLKSPALDFIKSFRLSALSMEDLMNRGFSRKKIAEVKEQDIGQISRRNVCEWVYENREKLAKQMIPYDYPRFFNTVKSNITMRRVGLGLVILTFVLLAITMALTLKLEIKETVNIFGVGCWVWILLGFALIEAGSILLLFEHIHNRCGLKDWFQILGRMIQLVPILIKVGTINRMTRFTRAYQRANVKPRHLNCIFLGAISITVIFLTLWYKLDPVKLERRANLVQKGGHDVAIVDVCECNSGSWYIACLLLWLLLISSASIIIYQSRDVTEAFNESRGLALMIYSHFIFGSLYILVYCIAQANYFNEKTLFQSVVSVLMSLDTIFAVSFYFGQKFFAAMDKERKALRRSIRFSRTAAQDKGSGEITNSDEVFRTKSVNPIHSKFSQFFG
mmetsp:Transcript_931/g.1213  ORF Transcript_931/g.1213 Transcript_931/m.1213 type:complete len:846 (-) Transcript_931:357-2894(-)